MIRSFAHKGLERYFLTGKTSGIKAEHTLKLKDILGALQSAQVIKDLNLPGFDLHPLKGNLAGHWSVKVNKNWRVIFRFEEGDVYVVNYLDYH